MSSSPVHKASLVSPATHAPALLELVEQKLTRPVIEYLIDTVINTVDYALGRPERAHRGRSLGRNEQASAFATMAYNVLTRAEVEMPVVLATLAYLDRARPHLHIALEEWANERVFLGALIVASKYTNDSSLKNIHWAMCTGIFGKRDIGRIEREFLSVLDWELSISEADVLAHLPHLSLLIPALHRSVPTSPFLALPSPASPASSSTSSSPLPALHHSPASSVASFSPPTPYTLVEEPVRVGVVKHSREPSAELPAREPVAKHASGHSALKLLRNFPFPRHHHHHLPHHSQQGHARLHAQPAAA